MTKIFLALGFILAPTFSHAVYRATWINRHVQFGQVTYTLLLDDDQGIRPQVRVEKNFPVWGDIDGTKIKLEPIEGAKAIHEQDNPLPKQKSDFEIIEELRAEIEDLKKSSGGSK